MKIFSILLVTIGGFIFNIFLYYFNESYRIFLENLKAPQITQVIDDSYSIDSEEVQKTLEDELKENVSGIIIVDSTIKWQEEELILSKWEEKILSLFSAYELTELKSHWSLFDVTSEYPDNYFEYYTLDITLYFFSTKSYEKVREIFEVESGDMFQINELDNFGDESFYINLGESYKDWDIRVVIVKDGIVFWLKISKNEYNNVKRLLEG